MAEQGFHFFATTAREWVTDDSEQKALERLSQRYSAKDVKFHVDQFGGIDATIVKVMLPNSWNYSISEYLPQIINMPGNAKHGERVPIKELRNIRLTDRKGGFKMK